MITTATQYNSNLHLLHNMNPPAHATLPLPGPENIYNVDIATREISAPAFLGIEKDAAAETIYFIVDRYADYMDLANTSCIIIYTNALGKTRFYDVPFYDIYSYAKIDNQYTKIVFPWCLDADVAEAPGEVEFSIMFFKTKEVYTSQRSNEKEIVLQYCLNTLPAKSKVLSGIDVKMMQEGYQLDASQYQELIHKINTASTWTRSPITWTVLSE